MSTIAGTPRLESLEGASTTTRLRAYFFSDIQRTVQTLLGLLWLIDGGLQFQSFMYRQGFVSMLKDMVTGQPHWLGSSISWAADTLHHHQGVYNTGFALVQVAIGLAILYRPTLRIGLGASFVWALIVWWFGEAFGMLFMNMANALTGAPGAVSLYALVGAVVWPNGRPGGLLGVRGARLGWAALWLVMAGLWLLAVNSTPDATRDMINAAPSGMSWLSSTQDGFASAAAGHGLIIALVLAAASAAIGVAVAANWRPRAFLAAAIVLNLVYWVVGQGFGGIFQGNATDPNAGPLFVLLALALWPLTAIALPRDERLAADAAGAPAAQPAPAHLRAG